ncbi:MAG: hypothetical protein JSV64_02075, partial [Candidatus Bathyarchaeota archaeon]
LQIMQSGVPQAEAYAKSIAVISEAKSRHRSTVQDLIQKANEKLVASQMEILKDPSTVNATIDVAVRHAERSLQFPSYSVDDMQTERKSENLKNSDKNGKSNSSSSSSEKEGTTSNGVGSSGTYVPTLAYAFCIPPNPIPKFLRLHAELNLYKIHHCRNIAGMERKLEPYAAPTDTISGLSMIGGGEQISIPGDVAVFPTPYRYTYLIERAKQFIQVAQQIENAFLTALEKLDAEAYSLMKARQDKQLAQAGVRLQDLRVRGAKQEIELAELQKRRTEIQAETYEEWIDAGFLTSEKLMIGAYITAGAARIAAAEFEAAFRGAQTSTEAATASFGAGVAAALAGVATAFAIATALSRATAIAAETTAQVAAVYASFERRKQEWELGYELALQDGRIAMQLKKNAENNLKVVGQERNIAKMQLDFADDTLNFLANKFTNVELYEWMSRILEEVYCYFLEQATSIARLASNQLSFERQEQIPSIIKQDYWEAPSEEAFSTEGEGPDRRGLTGSTRLLKDIYELDQYAFETWKRKLQLTKTISLARLAPAEFQKFRETGMLRFDTPMVLFDQDFPGHYLRLIKQVRVSVIALVPPAQGIHATLATSGLSRVVVRGPIYQSVRVRRSPESVALTSPMNATGLFNLQPETKTLNPFESIGVDTTWEFKLPKASNQFDFQTIADVLITMDYTALDSYDYRREVLSELDRQISGDLPISIRFNFPDSWYHLHNPISDDERLKVILTTDRSNFPPNVNELMITGLLAYFSIEDKSIIDGTRVHLSFREEGASSILGGEAVPIDGSISTLRGNAGGWAGLVGKTPFGEWELSLPNTPETQRIINDGLLDDILLVVTYSGQTPEWPE